MKRIVEYMPINGKALALLLSSSELRLGEAIQLRQSNIDFDSEPVKVKVKAATTKTGKSRLTFMSMEAKERAPMTYSRLTPIDRYQMKS